MFFIIKENIMSMECQQELSKTDLLFRIQSLEQSLTDAVQLLKQIKHETIRWILDDAGETELSEQTPDVQDSIEDYEAQDTTQHSAPSGWWSLP